jgi:hypothetical protein
MQVANSTPSAWSSAAAGLLDEPHAASTSAHPMTPGAIACRILLLEVGAMSSSELAGSRCSIHGYNAVTPV